MLAPRAVSATALVTLAAVVMGLAACDTDDGKELRPPTSDQRAAMTTSTSTTSTTLPGDAGAFQEPAPTSAGLAPATFTLQVPWAPGGPIDARFTCDGEDRSPLLIWSAPPAGTVELALLVTDDDADGFVHWAVIGIPPTAGEVGEGAQITGALEGLNDFGRPGWDGPCPPDGAPHTYRFILYALGQEAELPDGFTGAELRAAAAPASVGLAEATGVYGRAG